MQILSLSNAEVSISGIDIGEQQFIAGAQYVYDQEPQEHDTPSGTWWLWPLRTGILQIDTILEPGTLPPAIPGSLTPTDITVSASGHTMAFTDIYLQGFSFKVKMLGPTMAMPAIQMVLRYFVLKDDDGESGNYTPE